MDALTTIKTIFDSCKADEQEQALAYFAACLCKDTAHYQQEYLQRIYDRAEQLRYCDDDAKRTRIIDELSETCKMHQATKELLRSLCIGYDANRKEMTD